MATPFCLRSHAKHVHTASSSVTNFAFAPLSHTTQKPDNQATIIVPANVVIETGKCVCVCVCVFVSIPGISLFFLTCQAVFK